MKTTGLRANAFRGAVAFAMKSFPGEIKKFYDLVLTGDGVSSKGPENSAWFLRDSILKGLTAHAGWTGKQKVILCTLVACKSFVERKEMAQLKASNAGLEFFKLSLVAQSVREAA